MNNSEILDKVVVWLQTKYKNAKSFIRPGPIEFIKRKNNDNIIYFNNNTDETAYEIKRYIKRRVRTFRYSEKTSKLKDINLISGQYYFIILLLYFYRKLDVNTLNGIIHYIYTPKYNAEEFDIVRLSAMKRLFKEGMIIKEMSTVKVIQYKLTDKGYDFANLLKTYISSENRTSVIDKIRLKIMYSQYY